VPEARVSSSSARIRLLWESCVVKQHGASPDRV
jgi:hypothetical protein